MNRKFKFQDLDGEHIITEEQIINTYYPYWIEQMKKVNLENQISIKNCIEDWMIVHWAEEIN